MRRFQEHGVKISKIHLSSALKVRSTRQVCEALAAFVDDVYLHQVVARSESGEITRYQDLDLALAQAAKTGWPAQDWRIHFHVPLHSPKSALFDNTSSDITELFAILETQPTLCPHFEIETYTWEVLPPNLKSESVVAQLAREYEWCLEQMTEYGLASKTK